MLGEKQKDLLQYIGEYQAVHGFVPSVREVMLFLKVKSTNTAQYHLNRLRAEGYLEREKGRARALYLTERTREFLTSIGQRVISTATEAVRAASGASAIHRGIPLMGRITAGGLDAAIEDAQGSLELAEFIGADGGTFALRIQGDSMVGAGILDGDIVIVRRQPELHEGEIGVVLVDGETSCKTVHYSDDEIVLQPANEKYSAIRIPRNHPALEVCGRVIGVVRRV
jgi:repressor LexA